MAWKLIQLDLFRTSGFIQKESGEKTTYQIEKINEEYFCFAIRKKKKTVVLKSKNILLLDFSSNTLGIEVQEIF